ncbi:MAG: sugar transporter [Pedobacter sp.]|nr:MAG: sugar transporter [Pedobacter sp.]
MKRIALILTLVIFSAAGAFAQLENPVTWSYVAKKTGKNEATIYLRAIMEDGWHIYSQNVKPGGPNKTSFKFAPSKDFTLVGTTAEPKPISKFEKSFNMNVDYFEEQATFSQKIKLAKGTTTVKGVLNYMVCNDKSCLPPKDVAFSIPVK